MKKLYLIIIVIALVGAVAILREPKPSISIQNSVVSSAAPSNVAFPIDQPASRITKKFYDTHVTPQNSPVQPERFTGYHTGLDFETFSNEQNADVEIRVICTGKILQKERASGYGGYAVQACSINERAVTVVYGHLRALNYETPH